METYFLLYVMKTYTRLRDNLCFWASGQSVTHSQTLQGYNRQTVTTYVIIHECKQWPDCVCNYFRKYSTQ